MPKAASNKPPVFYLYEIPDATGKIRYVEARNREQAIVHVFHPVIRTLSARDAVALARNPDIIVEHAGPQDQPELPGLPAAPSGEEV